jgi:DNA polymerase I
VHRQDHARGVDAAPPPLERAVHDELLFEARENEAEAVAALVRDHMQRAAALAVPLIVDVGIGKNWMEAKG